MARPHFGPSRFKPRPRSDGYNDEAPEDHHSPHSRSPRGFRVHRGKAPTSWRDNRVIARPHPSKRPPLMGERREGERQPANQWRSPNQGHFPMYPPQNETHHGHRRPSPSRPNRPPQPQRRPSPHSPAQTSPSQRGPPMGHGHHSAHHSPSLRHYHGQAPDRRPAPTPPPARGAFRGLPRRPGSSREEERHWSPRRPHNLRETGPPARGGKRWIERGGFPHRGARGGPSGFAQRKPREFPGRGPYPERWSAERDGRKQHHGEEGRDREASGHRGGGMWSQEGGSPHHPPHRSPSWKGGPSQPSSFYPNNAQKRPDGPPPPQKRSFQEPPAGPDPEQRNHFKHPLRDPPPFHGNSSRGFGGRPLSLKDKSRIVKGRKMRAESVMRLRAPPRPRGAEMKPAPPKPSLQEDSPHRATLAMRKERFQANADPLRRRPSKPAPPQSPPPSPDGNESKSSKESESAGEQVESPGALREHSSSPIERLPQDLVVVSQWQAPATRTSSHDRSSSRERTSKTRTERYFNTDNHPTLNERSSKMHNSNESPKDQRERYTDPKNHRQADVAEENRPVRPFRKPAPPQRPGFRPGPRRTFPEPPGSFRKPLMGSFAPRPFMPRPFPSQRPGFRRNQPFAFKSRSMQGPFQAPWRGSNHRRW